MTVLSTAPLTSPPAATLRDKTTVSDAVADVTARNTDILFGLMGNGNAFYVSSLTSRGFRYVSARHEAGVVAMADAYHRASGKVATASVTYGAGFTNSLTALVEATKARIPMVLVVGGVPLSGARSWDIDQDAVAAGLGVESFTVGVENAYELSEQAYMTAVSGRRPVILAIPYDIAAVPVGRTLPGETGWRDDVVAAASPAVETARDGAIISGVKWATTGTALEEIAKLLIGSKRPLLIAGRGAVVAQASTELRSLGDTLGALFATSAMARNVFDSPWDLGVAGGFARQAPVALMRSADVVLVAGASLNAFQTRYETLFGSDAVVIQVDELPDATSPLVTHFISGEVKSVTGQLREIVGTQLARQGLEQKEGQWRSVVPEVAAGLLVTDEAMAEFAPDGRLNPRAVAQSLNALLPRERTMVQDGGHFCGWMPMYCSAADPQGFIMVGTAFQTIGLGIPSAVGAAIARPDRLTVLVAGDGGALMALSDLATAVQHIQSGVMVVFNDAAYGAELHQYAVRGLDPEAMLIDEVDFSAIGRAMGATGAKMTSLADLEALRTWLSDGAKGLFVLDVSVSRVVVADYMEESMAGILADLEN